ncbi:cytochrome c oxidase assembly protein [Nocardia flavorosea]|uniref:Cytochrome c oxidase assembly protein n=1 Tax=Nocardia flavorosea TaxID=53429 RepID=A0A846YBI6_9NOCA|nr:cytochrome c oxidase assembly protein [Nocardia flavorosea]NKY56986.1 cytochrome c oxidase assembly protein [Nocardia flavorosea]
MFSTRAVWAGAAAAAVVAVAGATITAGETTYTAAGTAFPGIAQALCYAVLRAVAMVAGALTLGASVYTVCCTGTTRRGRVGVDGYAGLRVVERAATIWLVTAVALIPVTAADIGGTTTVELLRAGTLGPLLDASEKPKAWVVVALLAAIVALVARLTLSWLGAAATLLFAAIGVLPPVLVGNAGEGPGHDYATGAVLLFQPALSVCCGLLWCASAHLRRGGAHRDTVIHRVRMLTTGCLIVAAATGLLLVALLLPPDRMVTTGYGRLVLGAAILGVLVALLAWRSGREGIRAGDMFGVAGATVLVAIAVLAAAGVRPAPAFEGRRFTAHEAFIGFDIVEPPTALRLLTFWRFDMVLGSAALAGIVLYCAGVLCLRRRGDGWSPRRTLSWILGCLTLLVATSSGIGAYGYAMFSLHMITHMTLNMVVPVLLVLGAPMTLLLRVTRPAGKGELRGVREGVLAVLHSRPSAVLAHPGFSIPVFVVTLYGLYFTSLFENLISYHWGHVLMNVHFLIVGYLFYWAIVGIDPGPRRLPHLGRLGMLFAIMPFHAFFGVVVMSTATVIGGRFYTNLQLPWGIDLLADQHAGGGIAWVSGEVPVLLVVGALLTQWITQDRRTAVRTDRKDETYGDSDLDAYNAMLAELARSRR